MNKTKLYWDDENQIYVKISSMLKKRYRREYQRVYWFEHKTERREYCREYARNHRGLFHERQRKFYKNHPEFYKKRIAKRRKLGFIELNSPFEGSEAHHIDRVHIINVPRKLHRSIWHNIFSGIGMKEVNGKVFRWFWKQMTVRRI
jgi:hypothetical protein